MIDCINLLAQVVEAADHTAPVDSAMVPMDTIWQYITTINLLEALTFISFGTVCLFYGWRVFKILVTICFAMLGLGLGAMVADKVAGESSQIWGALIGLVALTLISIPLIRWSVCLLGAAAGGILSSGIWYACGLNENYILAGALIGIIAGGMISFIIFKIAVMLFSSLGGSSLIATGALAVLYLNPQTQEYIEKMVLEEKWFLPAVLIVPTLIGLLVQNKFIKNTKDWDI